MNQRARALQILPRHRNVGVKQISNARPRTGRDSSFVKSMSRNANTLNALNRAPGVFGSVNTIIVLSAFSGSDAALLITIKRVMFSLKSWMPSASDSRLKTSAARAEAIAAASFNSLSRIIFALPAVS